MSLTILKNIVATIRNIVNTAKTHSHGTIRLSCSFLNAFISIIEVTSTARAPIIENSAATIRALRTKIEVKYNMVRYYNNIEFDLFEDK